MRRYVVMLIQLALLTFAAMPAQAERRVALVIGNGAYQNAPALPNPRHDAEDVGASLKRAGFETIVGFDLDQSSMQEATIKFSRAARAADVAIFYYSGHAMQYAGVNYLAPIDIKLTDEADLRRMTRVDDVVADLQQAKNLRILILDSCRDNPLAEQLKRSIGVTRAMSIQRGLAKIDTPEGMIVAYATQAGKTADDGDGRNSPYTAAFLKHIQEKDEIGTVFRRITASVYDATNHQQLPELSLSLIGEYYLYGRVDPTVAAAPAASAPSISDPCAAASEHWRSSEAMGTIAAYEDHLKRFPNCAFAGLAAARLDDLKKKVAAVIPAPPLPAPHPASAPTKCGNTTTVSLADQCTIKVGQTLPQTGPASAYAAIGKAQAAYFRMINEQGGINGRKINLIQYDDGYSPPKTVEQVRRLVESDNVLFMFQMIGTPANAALQKYLNVKKVPQLFAASGASRFADPRNYPWTMAFNPNYFVEARIQGQFIRKTYPNARIGILYQNDDFGRDFLNGIKAGLGDKAASMIVAEAPYETSEPTVDPQILKLKDAGADLLFDASTPKFAAQAIKKTYEIGWHPVHILDTSATSVAAVLQPAGLQASTGVISVNFAKDPTDPTWRDDAGMKRYFAFMDRYYPEGDKTSQLNAYGYSTAQLLVYTLKQCGDDLTRENVMKQASSLRDVALDLALPGIKVNTSPTDFRVIKQLQMMRFNGERWQLFGPIVSADD